MFKSILQIVFILFLALRNGNAEPNPAQASVSESQEAPQEAIGHLPLMIVEAQSLLGEKSKNLPLLMIGRLPEKQDLPADLNLGHLPSCFFTWYSMFWTKGDRLADLYGLKGQGKRPALEGLADGKLALRVPRAGSPVFLLLAWSEMNTGTEFGPRALIRRGNRFTLILESWDDNFPRRKNIPSRPAFLLSFCALEEGEYELQVEIRFLWKDISNLPMHSFYELKAVDRSLRLPFKVYGKAAPGLTSDAEQPPRLEMSALERAKSPSPSPPPEAEGLLWQRPYSKAEQVGRGGNLNGLPRWGLLIEDSPALLTGPARKTVAWITGPQLDSYQWMSLREIAWKQNQVILGIDLWCDTGGRDKNYTFFPRLSALLETPGNREGDPKGGEGEKRMASRGKYQATVDWAVLVAPQPGEVYMRDDKRRAGWLKGIPSLAEFETP